jgi:phage gp36-like protein
MSYATREDFVNAFGEEETDALEARGVTAETALASAAAEVESYLAGYYALPLSPAPEIIRDAVLDIARFRWWKDGASEAVQDRYEQRIAWLKEVSRGHASVPGATPVSEPRAGHSPVRAGQAASNFDWAGVL